MSLDLWHTWNDQGRQRTHFTPLMKAHHPLVEAEVARFGETGLPPIALRAEARKLLATGLKTYDPIHGTQLSTHLINQLRPLGAYVATYQAPVRRAREKQYLASRVWGMKQDLEATLGREATNAELAAHTGLGTHTLGSLAVRSQRLYSTNQDGDFDQPGLDLGHDAIVADFLHENLTPVEQLVFEHSTGYNGREMLAPHQMATRMNLSPQRVSDVRNQIAKKVLRYRQAVDTLTT